MHSAAALCQAMRAAPVHSTSQEGCCHQQKIFRKMSCNSFTYAHMHCTLYLSDGQYMVEESTSMHLHSLALQSWTENQCS